MAKYRFSPRRVSGNNPNYDKKKDRTMKGGLFSSLFIINHNQRFQDPLPRNHLTDSYTGP